ncbi:MAG: hypothetical protein EPO67_00650 [Reyranella sp.]|nr:MAG: hypothetical protein EPO67_00650 [Reyranella sp.]
MRAVRIAAVAVLAIAVALGLAFAGLQTTPGKRLLASVLSDEQIRVGTIEGFVPTDLRVVHLEVVDRDGPWLQVDNARLVWSFASLFGDRLRIETLAADRVALLRTPVAEAGDAKASEAGPLRLPFGIDLQAVRIDNLHLGAALGGYDSHWRVAGSGTLANDLGEMAVKLGADRFEGPVGKLAADIRLERSPRRIAADVTLDEDRGGMIAALLQQPDLPKVSLRLRAHGDQRDGNAELSVTAGEQATARGTARWQGEGVDARLQATLEAGPVTAARQGVSWKALRFSAEGTLADAVRLQGKIDGLALMTMDPRLPQPGDVSVEAAIALRNDKVMVRSFDVAMPVARVTGEGIYATADGKGDVRATIDVPSVAPLSAMAQRALQGRLRVKVAATLDKGALDIRWDGALNDFGAPDVPENLIATVNLVGAAGLAPDGAWTLRDARLFNDTGTLTISGRGREQDGALDLGLDLPRLAAFRADVGGRASAAANITFGGAETGLKLRVDTRDVSYQGIVAERMALDTTVTASTNGAITGTLKADGVVQSQPLILNGRFAHEAANGLSVPSLQGRWSNAVLDITDLAVGEARTTGRARLDIAELKDVAALAEAGMSGKLNAEVTADPAAPAGRLDIKVTGSDLVAGGLAARTLDLSGHVDDPAGVAATDLNLIATGLGNAGGLSTLRATAKGDRTAIDITAQASGAELAGDLAAKVEPAGDQIKVALSKFTGRWRDIPVGLNAPTKATIAGQRIVIDSTNLRVGAGRVALRGALDPVASDMAIELAGLPLTMIETFAPGTGLEGMLQAKLRATGPMGAPRIEANYTATGLRLRRPDAALLPALSLQGTGTLVGHQASLDARLAAGTGSNLSVKGTARLPQGAAPLKSAVTIGGVVDAAPFAPILGNDIRGVTGRLRPAVTVTVDGARITGTGAIDFEGGNVALPESGLRLSNGQGRFVLQDDTVQIQRLAFQAGTGSVNVSGSLRLDATQGIVPALDVAAQRALLVSRPDLVATISAQLKVTGATTSAIEIAGPVTIDRAEIAVGGVQSADYPMVAVREINKPGVPPAKAPPSAKQPARKPPPPGATPIRLALEVRAPQAVFVRGRGLDAEMGGTIKVSGSPFAPQAIGGLTVRRGAFSLGGRRLNFSKGIVTLDNLDAIDPRLDFLATTSAGSATIGVAITGTSRAPALAITSSPAMPPDEAMALLIFGKPASQLGASELLQVAAAVGELTGKSPGDGVLSRLRKGLGLDQLSVGSSSSKKGEPTGNAAESVSLEAGRYVAPGVYVGAKQGAAGNSSRGVVQIEVLDNIKLEGDIGADSRGRVGVKTEWDY